MKTTESCTSESPGLTVAVQWFLNRWRGCEFPRRGRAGARVRSPGCVSGEGEPDFASPLVFEKNKVNPRALRPLLCRERELCISSRHCKTQTRSWSTKRRAVIWKHSKSWFDGVLRWRSAVRARTAYHFFNHLQRNEAVARVAPGGQRQNEAAREERHFRCG